MLGVSKIPAREIKCRGISAVDEELRSGQFERLPTKELIDELAE